MAMASTVGVGVLRAVGGVAVGPAVVGCATAVVGAVVGAEVDDDPQAMRTRRAAVAINPIMYLRIFTSN